MKRKGSANEVSGDRGAIDTTVEFRRRKGSRRLVMRLDHRNRVVVAVPWHCSNAKARAFVRSNRAWIEAQRAAAPPLRTVAQWLGERPWVAADGAWAAVRREAAAGRARYRHEIGEGRLIVVARDADAGAVVRRFARVALKRRAGDLARRVGTGEPGLTVRNQCSRWGSCSSRGRVSLNWRLVLASPGAQDYVILHELAHLREMNHSKRFWELLDAYDPDRRRHEAELKAAAPELMRVE